MGRGLMERGVSLSEKFFDQESCETIETLSERRSDMFFKETSLRGAHVIELDKREESRGFFARTFCQDEFLEKGLKADIVQANVSFNRKKGTLRGMHFQADPFGECKIVRCDRGAIYDVIIDLRPDSGTFQSWFGIALHEGDGKMLYIPEHFAHGYLTLENHSEVFYLVTQAYVPDAGRGVPFDDPAFAIQWPAEVAEISEQDRSWKRFKQEKVAA